eukprot:gene2310-4500_t
MKIIRLYTVTLVAIALILNASSSEGFITRLALQLKSLSFRTPNSKFCLKMNSDDIFDSKHIPIPLNTSRIAEVVKVVAEAFPYESDHSWSRALNLPSNLTAFLNSVVPEYISESPGSIAVLDNNFDIKGVLLLEDFVEKLKIKGNVSEISLSVEQNNKTESAIETKYAAIGSLLQSCRNIFLSQLKVRTDTIFDESRGRYCYVAWIAVRDQDRKTGVAAAMLRHATDDLRHLGYKYAIAYCASPTSTRAFVREGYEIWGKIPYSEFELANERPFAILPDEVSVVVKVL